MMRQVSSTEPSAGIAARAAALDLLTAVLGQRRSLDDAFGDNPDIARLEPRDRAFTRLLAATALRRLGQTDALIRHCLTRELPPAAIATHHLLRLGVVQLLFVGTPAHAAVDTTVSLAVLRGQERYKGLINAILRRLAREGPALIHEQDVPRLSTPEWLWESWSQAYGEDTARAIAEAHLQDPPLDFTIKNPADESVWAERLDAQRLPTGSLRVQGSRLVPELPGFTGGAWWIQDAAAALPARLLGDITEKTVIDLAAAPGGKTAQLASMGARVTAVDISAKRLANLSQNLSRLGLDAKIVAADATVWRPTHPADAILVDAPCSATGTIRRHPDVAHLKRPRDIARLADLQSRMLRAAVEMLTPGGALIYCSCSLQPEEGPQQIAALLAAGAPVTRRPITAAELDGHGELIDANGDLRTLPCHFREFGGIDGFYAARLRRDERPVLPSTTR